MQHISILTAGSDIHEPLINHMKDQISVGESYCITRENYGDVVEKLSMSSPFFSDYLLVEIICDGFDLDNFKKLTKKLSALNECKFIFKHNKRELFEFTEKAFENLFIINNYKPQQKLLTLYLKTYCDKYVTADAEDELYKRMNGQWSLLSTVLLEISEIPHKTITKKDIENLITSSINLNVNKLVNSLITGNGLKNQVKVLFNYKYANRYVYKKIAERASFLIELKKDYIKGVLRFNNLHEYASEHKISSFTLETVMDEILTKYSLEYLYKFKFIVKKYEKDPDGVLQILLEMV